MEDGKKEKRRSPAGCLLKLAVALAVATAALVVVLNYCLGSIIEKAAPLLGPQILGTPVSVSNATARILTGRIGLSGLVVGPPEGFDANVFEMSDFRFDLDVKTLSGGPDDPIVIREIAVEGPVVSYELKGLRDNLHAILDKIGSEEAAEEESPEAEKAKGRKVAIDHFVFKNGKVRIAVAGGKGAVVPLPTIELSDIGTKSGGVTAIEAVGQILSSITLGTVEAAKDAILDLGGAAVDAAGAAIGAAADAASAMGDAAGAAIGAIGSLFGSSDDDSGKDGGEKPSGPAAE